MKYTLIEDYYVSGLGEFLEGDFEKDSDILLKNTDYKSESFENKCEKIEYLIEQFGSDEDVICEALEVKYPNKDFFTLCDFIEGNMGSFRIRIWKLEKPVLNNYIIYDDMREIKHLCVSLKLTLLEFKTLMRKLQMDYEFATEDEYFKELSKLDPNYKNFEFEKIPLW